MSIGQRIKEARIARLMTQTELAEAIGVTNGAIGNYETDVSSPKESILIKLMDVLNIDANYVYQDYMKTDMTITGDELRLLSLFRGANDQAKSDALDLLSKHQKKDTLSKAE